MTPLVSPEELKVELPISDAAEATVIQGRSTIQRILGGEDSRLLAVVGPCSIHDPEVGYDYARRLAELSKRVGEQLFVVMRVYFEKPRTRLGWRGLILDPALDGSYDIPRGLRTAREVLLRINEMGVPAGSEMLDPLVPQYIADLLAWASIGARTTESQTHREMAGGLSMPVGFKNGTDGSVEPAVNAMASSRSPRSFIGIDNQGRTSILETSGHRDTHLILRGGKDGPNYHDEAVEDALKALEEAGLDARIVVDCSHGNSRKDFNRQEKVLTSVIRQRLEGRREIVGFMMESNIAEGRQSIPSDPQQLAYGVSVTDPCIGWETTERLLTTAADKLAAE
jgi:3-deoxy-7-phosphoheptulonate synthase